MRKIKFLLLVPLFIIGLILVSCGNSGTTDSTSSSNNDGGIPIYTGMTISKNKLNTNNMISQSGLLNDPKENGNNGNGYGQEVHGNPHDLPDGFPPFDNHNNKPGIENPIDELGGIDVTVDDSVKYFVSKSEIFIIEVHVSNPNNYEIQSFTLNGQKYANYMFKNGSTMELLLLEVTAPNVSGYTQYTIDAIKYIDGTEIKDVDISKAEKSIKVGVTYDNLPVASISNFSVLPTSVSFDLNIRDNNNLIGNNELKLMLSDGETIISELPLIIGNNKIEINNLRASRTYEYGVVTSYDIVDGNYNHEVWMLKNRFNTSSLYTVSIVSVGKDNVLYEINEIGSNGNITSISINDVATGETFAATYDKTLCSFSNLLSNKSYNLYVDYEYTTNGIVENDWVMVGFTTYAKLEPELNINSTESDKTSITFDYEIIDADNILTISKIELFKDGEVVQELSDITTKKFEGLLSNTEYEIRITYIYDLNDGNGSIEKTISKTEKTNSKLEPNININSIESDKTSITFDYEIIDEDNILTISKIELLKDGEVVQELSDITTKKFEGLLSNTEYEVRITYTYDLNDGNGEITNYSIENARTLAKKAPVISIFDELAEKSKGSLKFDENGNVSGLSDNYTGEVLYINAPINSHAFYYATGIEKVFIGQNCSSIGFQAFYGSDLKTVVILRDFIPEFLGDVFGIVWDNSDFKVYVQDNIYQDAYDYIQKDDPWWSGYKSALTKFSSMPSEIGELTYFDSLPTDDSISCKINYIDEDNTILMCSISLYKGDELIGKAENILNYKFEGLLSNSEYEIRITYTYDLNDGNGSIEKTISKTEKTNSKLEPNININSIESDKTSITFDYEIIDEDNILTISKIELLKDGEVVQELSDITTKKFEGLLSNTEYEIRITYIYDLNDGNGSIEKTISKTEKTFKYLVQFVDLNDDILEQCFTDEEMPTYQSQLPTKDSDYEFDYSFNKWEIKEETNELIIYYPIFSKKTKGLIINNGMVTGYTGTLTNVIVPDCWEGVIVKTIDYSAFKESSLKTIILPTTIETIEANAFENSSLTSIEIPEKISLLPEYIFSGCSNLKTVVLNENIKTIGFCAFRYCGSLKSINLPNTLTTINSWAFQECDSLNNLVLPNSLVKIDSDVFYRCTSLSSLDLPSNLRYIGVNAFNECSIELNVNYETWKLINGKVNVGYTSTVHLFDNNNLEIKEIIVPSDVEEIEDGAFRGCAYLEKIDLSNCHLESIGKYAFYNCQLITELSLLDGITSIGDEAFGKCYSLVSFVMPNSVDTIGRAVFGDCMHLKNIVLSSSLTKLTDQLFVECDDLEIVIIPEGVTTIVSHAFDNCGKLTSVVIPSTIKKIEKQAFTYSWDIRNVYCYCSKETWESIMANYSHDYDNLYLATAYYYSEDPIDDGWYLDNGIPTKWVKYELNITKNIESAGTVTGAGEYYCGTQVSITAASNDGFTFDGWYVDDKRVFDKLTYQFEMTSNDITYEARWYIQYTVEHYQQNLLNNGYTKIDTEYLDGYAGTLTTANAKSYSGYDVLEYNQEYIKDDGPTVIKIYYDKTKHDVVTINSEDVKLKLLENGLYVSGINVENLCYIVSYVSSENESLSASQLLNKEDVKIQKYDSLTNNALNLIIDFNLYDIESSSHIYYCIANDNMTNLDDTVVYKKEIKYINIDTKEKFNTLARSGKLEYNYEIEKIAVYNLIKDLDYENNSWNTSYTLGSFSGLFNGNNHKISNIKVEDLGYQHATNVFYSLDCASIYNVTFENINLKNHYDYGKRIGIIGIMVDSHIENVKVINSSFIGVESVGAIVGLIAGGTNEITKCQINNDTDSKISVINKYAGGIVGNVQMFADKTYITVNINNCSVIANIGELNETGTTGIDAGGNHGGIVGRVKNDYNSYNVSITNCFYKGTIIAQGLYNAGILGDCDNGVGFVIVNNNISIVEINYRGTLISGKKMYESNVLDDASTHKYNNAIVGRAIGENYETSSNLGTFNEYNELINSKSIYFDLSVNTLYQFDANSLTNDYGFDNDIWYFDLDNNPEISMTIK